MGTTSSFPTWGVLLMLQQTSHLLPWEALFLLLPIFGFHVYVLRNREDCRRIQKQTGRFSSHKMDQKKPYGYILGWNYVGHIERNHENDMTVHLVCSERTFDRLLTVGKGETTSLRTTASTDEDDREKSVQEEEIDVYHRTGSYYCTFFAVSKLIVKYAPILDQSLAVASIEKMFRTKSHLVVFLYGPTGTGKSSVAPLVAQKLNAAFCPNLKLWSPGETIEELYHECQPTVKRPLVILLDEIDQVLEKIHRQTLSRHKSIPTAILDKTDWNQFLDRFQFAFFPHTIIVMTSNHSTKTIAENMDPSYLREGRIDLAFEMTNTLLP